MEDVLESSKIIWFLRRSRVRMRLLLSLGVFTRQSLHCCAACESFCSNSRLSTPRCCCTQLAAKCETRQALFNIQAIAAQADCLIMSRGNLGLDVLPEKMALVQKAMINSCNLVGKPILITRVVDTMVTAPRPTRCGACFGCHAPVLPLLRALATCAGFVRRAMQHAASLSGPAH